MNTRGTSYGTVSKIKDNLFLVQFWNPLTQTKINLPSKKTYEEAKEQLREKNIEFFSDNSWLLPRGIGISKRDRMFTFTINLRGKTTYVFRNKDLDVVNQAKLDFINKLI
jgi:hypothetical protein